MQKPKPLKLRTKLILMFFGLFLSVTLAMIYVAYVKGSELLEKETRLNLKAMAIHTMDKIDRLLYEKIVQVRVISADPVIRVPGATARQIAERLVAYRNNFKGYISLSFYDLNLTRIADTAGLNIGQRDLTLKDNIPAFTGEKGITITIAFSPSLNNILISFKSSVIDGQGIFRGMVVAHVPIERLNEIPAVAAGIQTVEEQLQVDLIDAEGLFLYSNHDPGKVLKSKFHQWEDLRGHIQSGKTDGSFRFFESDRGGEMIFAFAKEQGFMDFKGMGWTLIIHLPVKTALQPVVDSRNQLLLILLVGLLLSAVFIIFFSFRIAKPLMELSAAAREVAKGNLDTQVVPTSGDEIGQLSGLFNDMTAEIRKSNERLEKYAENLEKRVTERTALLAETNEALNRENGERQRAEEKSESALKEERKTRREIETLHSALEVFTAKLDTGEIAQRLQQFLNRAVASRSTTLYLLKNNHLQVINAPNDSTAASQAIAHWDEVRSSKVWTWISTHEKPSVIEIEERKDELAKLFTFQADTRSLLVLPLTAQGRIFGCLTAEAGESDAFNEAGIRFASALANEASVALENARLFLEVKRLSRTDPLTSLRNRRAFLDDARRDIDIAIRNRHPLSVMMLDIDHFKRVNDTYGHATGDKVLVKIAQVCRKLLRKTDLLARFGGEEFCFLFPETTAENALLLAERIRTSISAVIFETEVTRFSVTVSIGISECQDAQDSLESLLARGDEALYQAKNTGRNRVVIWGPPYQLSA